MSKFWYYYDAGIDGQGRQSTETRSFCKVILMFCLRSYLLIVILAIGSLQVGLCQEKPAGAVENAPTKTELNAELRVFRDSLFGQGNVEAATVLLRNADPNARGVLLEALKQSENSPARIAVCNALIKAREQKETIKSKEDFIGPLLTIFASKIAAEANLAVKATLLIEYEKIIPSLEEFIKDSSKPFKTKANAIQALKLRRDMKVAIRLIELVDETAETDKQISSEAVNALSELGIIAGDTPDARKQKIEEIKRDGESEFLRNQLVRQETQLRVWREELNIWQQRYLSELEKRYKQITEDQAKSDFLISFFGDKEAVVRLWALDKAYKWRLVSQLPEPLGKSLIPLISDNNKDVRLITAELLSLMQRLNSAEPLLKQHQIEPDDNVKTKLFVALGVACSSAISGPPAEIPVKLKKIRSTTLKLAAEQYLFSKDDEKARNAAEVIRKLLIKDGLESGEEDKYLNLLSTRYRDEKDKPNGALRGVLMNAMASLCSPESTCKKKAHDLFKTQFEEALRDKVDYVREEAVNGLAYIDTTKALELLRPGFFNDPSETLRKKLISLVDEKGDERDLDNLAEKIGKNSEGELAWQAMLNIFRRLGESKTAIWTDWLGKLTSGKGGYTNAQRIAFLKIAEGKVPAGMKPDVRQKLGDLYYSAGQFENAADYFNTLYGASQESREKDALFKKLLDASLKGAQLERVTGLIGNHLSQGDLDPNGVIISLLNDYLGKPPFGANQKAVLKALEGIKVSQERPLWRHWLDECKAILSKEEQKQNEPAPANT
ncbi:MAG: hypothetical protein JXM79_22290 [Sedimentisphaerales bacterium]|nr:hypothetical protein [Sedimentisphaerales bacterium]